MHTGKHASVGKSRPYALSKRRCGKLIPLQLYCPADVAREVRSIARLNMLDITEVVLMALRLYIERWEDIAAAGGVPYITEDPELPPTRDRSVHASYDAMDEAVLHAAEADEADDDAWL